MAIPHGNIQPTDYNTHRLEEHRRLGRIYENVEKKLQGLETEMTSIVECGAFMVGFQLGVQLMKAC